MQCHLGTYCADPSGGFRLQFPCVLHVQFRWWKCRSARVADIINLYHTGYTESGYATHCRLTRGWLVFAHFDFVLDPSTCGHRAGSSDWGLQFVCSVTASADFLPYKRQLNYNWGFILVENLLLCLWFVWYFWSNKLADGSLYEYVGIIFI